MLSEGLTTWNKPSTVIMIPGDPMCSPPTFPLAVWLGQVVGINGTEVVELLGGFVFPIYSSVLAPNFHLNFVFLAAAISLHDCFRFSFPQTIPPAIIYSSFVFAHYRRILPWRILLDMRSLTMQEPHKKL
jgi:hypothetical protein